jgi:hypothetical protein
MGVMGALVAILQSHVPAERLDLALCGLSVAWGFAGPLMFPRLSFLSWFYVVMPALAWLEIRHGYHGWAPTAGILGAVLIGALMERLRYTGDARRMAAPISAVPALGRTGRILLAVGLLSGVVYTVLAHAVLRAPQPTSCGAYLLLLGLYLLGLGFAGAALLWCVMSLLPGRRNGKAYPVIRALGWCGVVGLTGFLSVGYSQEKDQALSGERAGQIQSALEEYRKAQGHYPAALQDLVPKYLVLIPSARAGWVEEPFEYERHATEPGNYQLFYYSAGGVKLFVSPDD